MQKKIFSNKILSIFFALVVSMFWGTLFPMIKIGYQAFGVNTSNVPSILLFAGLRFFISGVVLVGIWHGNERKIELPEKGQIKVIVLVSLFTVILHYAFTYVGLSICDSSKSAVLKQVGFLFLPCIIFLFRKDDKFSIYKVLGGILGFLSVIVINVEGMNFQFGAGDFLIILASFSSVIGQIISKNAYDKYKPACVVAYSQLFGGIVFIAVGFAAGGGITIWNLHSTGVLAYICFASICANLLWNTLIKYNNMSKLAVLKSMDPLFAAIFSGILLGEDVLKPAYLLALLLVVLAIAIGNKRTKV